MGKLFSKLGGKKRPQQLSNWEDGKEAVWNFTVNAVEVNCQLLKRKRSVESRLEEECAKRRRLESEVRILQKTTKKQSTTIAKLNCGKNLTVEGLHQNHGLSIVDSNALTKKGV